MVRKTEQQEKKTRRGGFLEEATIESQEKPRRCPWLLQKTVGLGLIELGWIVEIGDRILGMVEKMEMNFVQRQS